VANLLQEIKKSLPSFYQESIEDDGILDALYSAVADLVSEMYIRTMSVVLNSSVHTAVLDYSPEFRVVAIREALVHRDAGSWICNIDYSIKDIRTLSPDTESSGLVLERGLDFLVHAAGEYPNLGTVSAVSAEFPVIEFLDNPYNWGETGEALGSGSARTMYSVGPYILRRGIEDSLVYSGLAASEVIYIRNGESVTSHDVLLVVEEGDNPEGLEVGIYLAVNTPAPYLGNVICSTTSAGTSAEGQYMYLESFEYEHEDTTLYLMARKPIIDRRYVSSMYGETLGVAGAASSEAYRTALVYRMMLKTRAFNTDTLYSVIGMMLGVPYIVEQEELCLDVKALTNGSTVLETTYDTYEVPQGLLLRSSIQNKSRLLNGSANQDYIGEPTFLEQYETLSRPYTIYSSSTHEYSTDWWYGDDLVLPIELLPEDTLTRRKVGMGTEFDNKIGTDGTEEARIGDYCIEIGAAKRQRVAFRATKDFYKHRIIIVEKVNPLAPTLTDENKTIIQRSAPLDTFVLFKEQ
jgi:hypothetical protein